MKEKLTAEIEAISNYWTDNDSDKANIAKYILALAEELNEIRKSLRKMRLDPGPELEEIKFIDQPTGNERW